MSASLDIVIVNWNTGAYLRRALESIVDSDQGAFRLTTVTVVDNASEDGSADGLEDLAGKLPLRVLRNPSNVGFGVACNQGAEGSDADYLLLLNPDVELCEHTLSRVTSFMEGPRGAEVGICGVEVVGPNGRPAISCARFPTLRVMFGKMTGLDRALPGVFPGHHLRPDELDTSGFVDQVIGAFYFVRRELFTRLGGFDPRYFMYFEEVDLALRARRAGFRSYFLREARVVHAESVSAARVRDRRLFYSLRSRLLYARRHWTPGEARALLVLTYAVELPARLARALLRRDLSELAGTLSAYRMLGRRAPRVLDGGRAK